MQKKYFFSFISRLAFFLSFLFMSCASQRSLISPYKKYNLGSAREILSQLTLEEKIGQLFVITPNQLDAAIREKNAGVKATSLTERMIRSYKRYPVGGFILFGWNIESPEQTRSFISELKSLCPIPPILTLDEEGGRVTRLAKKESFYLPRFKSMNAIGDTGDKANAQVAGQIIGSYLLEFGFTLDLAPVADVNTNPENIVIGDRAFGSDPKLVSDMAGAFLSGLHSAGVQGCLKHFPGHGDTKDDTHTDYVAVTKTWEELKSCELIPFVNNLEQADCILVAHVTLSKAASDGYPASLSKELITGRLRGELGYKGIILTDALDMGAITKNYGAAEAAVLAFEAGNDILLMPRNFPAAFDALLAAVKSGRISMERLEESVLRILALKGY